MPDETVALSGPQRNFLGMELEAPMECSVYAPPAEGPIGEYQSYIATFPLIDQPEIFGLHQNADISFQQKETGDMLELIISLQPRASGSGAAGQQQQQQQLAARFMSMFALHTKRFDVFDAQTLIRTLAPWDVAC